MKGAVLITGANGEVGHGLIERFAKGKGYKVVVLDITSLDPNLKDLVGKFILMEKAFSKYLIPTISKRYRQKTVKLI